MVPGVYTLLLRLDSDCQLAVGALGNLHFSSGCYAYTGSARGPGGLRRVIRHQEVFSGQNKARRWHIDYLLPSASWMQAVITVTDQDLECEIARKISRRLASIPGFGCSDCNCQSHLHYSPDCSKALSIVRSAHRKISHPGMIEQGGGKRDQSQ